MPEAPQKIDRRVLYTKMFLREALLELLRDKPISKITPTELCRRAGINRNTFYTHFQSAEDLLENVEEELFDKVKSSLDQITEEQNISSLIEEICLAIAQNYELSHILLSENGDPHFLTRLISLAHDQTMISWRSAGIRADAALQEILYTYSVNGSVAVIREWVRQGIPQPPQIVAAQIERLTLNGLNAFMR